MKFSRMNESRIMSEMSESDNGGIDASSAFDASSQNVISDDNRAFKDLGLDPKKYGLDDESVEIDASSEESQGSEEDQKASQATDEKAYLDWINSLGAIHNDTPFKAESSEQIKELIQKGHDYTLKTQSLSEERKAWDNEKSSAERELNVAIADFNENQKQYGQQLQELQQWTFALKNLEKKDPDLFAMVQGEYEETGKQFSNPVLDQQLASIRAELAEARKGLVQKEDKLIIDGFESEYSKLANVEQSMKELGIVVNKDEVKKKWAATGLSPEEAIGAIYGMKAMQAQASKSKVDQTKAKVNARPIGSAGASRTGNKEKAIDPKLKGMAYAQALFAKHSA